MPKNNRIVCIIVRVTFDFRLFQTLYIFASCLILLQYVTLLCPMKICLKLVFTFSDARILSI